MKKAVWFCWSLQGRAQICSGALLTVGSAAQCTQRPFPACEWGSVLCMLRGRCGASQTGQNRDPVCGLWFPLSSHLPLLQATKTLPIPPRNLHRAPKTTAGISEVPVGPAGHLQGEEGDTSGRFCLRGCFLVKIQSIYFQPT